MIVKMSIVYVRSDYWGAKAVNDLLAQEKRCMAYAAANGLEVAKVFREVPWRKTKRGQLPEALRYARSNAERINLLIVHSHRTLSHFNMGFRPLLKQIEDTGVRVEFVSLQSKRKII